MANLYFEATLDADQLKRELRDVNNRLDGFTNQAKQQGAEMDATFKRIGAAMAGYFSITAAKGFVDQMIQVRGEFQQLDIALESMLQSKEKANVLMADVVEMAARTPFSLTDLGQATKQLLAVQEPAEDIVDTMRRLGDISAGLSVPISQLIKAYGDVRAKGKLMGQEMLQFMNAGVPMVAELAKQFNVTNAEVSELVAKGKVGFNDVKAVISNLSGEGGMFYNLMEKQSASLTGRISNLGDSWEQMLNKLGESNEGILYGGISALNSMVENYETVLDVLKAIVVTYGAYKGAVVLLHMAEKARNISGAISAWFSLAKGIKTAKDAQLAFNLATKMNPLGLAAAGVAALVAGIVLFTGKTEQAAGVSAEFSRDLEDQTKVLDANFKALKSTTSGTDARKLAIDQINSKYGPYLDNLLTEKSTLEEIEEAQKRATQELARSIAFKAQQADLETFREDIEKSENAFSQALKQLFALNDVPAEIGGQVAAELDKLMREWSGTDIKNRVGFGDAFAQVFKDAGAEIDLLGVKGNNAYKGLFQSMQTVIDARQDERKATEELSSAYDAYLKQLGLSDDSSKKKGTDTEDGEVEGFKLEDFKKGLEERKKAYDDYNDAVRNARDEDRAAVKGYYSELIKDGDTYKEYLEGLLRDSRDNVEATTAIYLAAAKANIDLIDDRPDKIGRRPGVSGVNAASQVTPINSNVLASLESYNKRWEESRVLMQQALETERLDQFGEKLIGVAYNLQDIARGVGQIDGELGAAMNGIADAVGQVGNISKLAAGGDTFGVITAGLNGALEITGMLVNSAKQRQAAEEAFYRSITQQQHAYNIALNEQLRLQSELAENVFSTDYEGRLTSGIEALKGASADYMDAIGKLDDGKAKIGQRNAVDWGNVGKGAAGGAAAGAAIGSIVPVIGTAIGGVVGAIGGAIAGLFGGKKKKDQYGGLLTEYPELIQKAANGQKTLNVELAKTLIDQKLVNQETSDALQNAIDQSEQMEKAREQIRGVIEDLAGSIGDDLRNALVTSFEDGTDAAKAFGESVENVLEDILSQMIFNAIFGASLDQLEKEMKESFDPESFDYDKSWVDDFSRFYKGMGEDQELFNKSMEEARKEAEKYGFSLFDGSDDASLSGAIKGVSEETASILAGQMNAIRINQAESLRLMNESARYWAEIAANTSYNKYLEGIHSDIKAMRSSGSDLKAKGF